MNIGAASRLIALLGFIFLTMVVWLLSSADQTSMDVNRVSAALQQNAGLRKSTAVLRITRMPRVLTMPEPAQTSIADEPVMSTESSGETTPDSQPAEASADAPAIEDKEENPKEEIPKGSSKEDKKNPKGSSNGDKENPKGSSKEDEGDEQSGRLASAVYLPTNPDGTCDSASKSWPFYLVSQGGSPNKHYKTYRDIPTLDARHNNLTRRGDEIKYMWGADAGESVRRFEKEFRFYLYDKEDARVFDAEMYLDCFRKIQRLANGSHADWFEPMDARVSIVCREYLPELTFAKALREHPLRTRDPEKASLFVIGYYPGLVYWSTPCHEQGPALGTEDMVIQHLKNNKYWTRNGGKDHLLLFTLYQQAFGAPFKLFMDKGPIIAANDRFLRPLADALPQSLNSNNAIIIPYVSSPQLDVATPAKDSVRNRLFYFRGNMHRRGVGWSRRYLLNISDMLQGADFAEKKPNMMNKRYQRPDLVNEMARTIVNADICLVPEGDSPTSLRLFEALAAGCVPVVMARKELIRLDLPFPNLIDWDSIAYFVTDLHAIGVCPTGLQEISALLKTLTGPEATPEAKEILRRKRENGMVVFRKYFSFFRNERGVVDGVLFEAWKLQGN